MDKNTLIRLFSKKRLSSFKDENEHINNFLLIQTLAPKLGILEIVTRNKIAEILSLNDDEFISKQTFGYWAKLINQKSIHNKLIDLSLVDFRKYSKFNKKSKLKNYQKVRICYDLLISIRNRAFHFENLLKTKVGKPRISTLRNGVIVGIDPVNLESFLNDILDCFDTELKDYLSGGKEKLPPLTSM